MVEWLFPRDDDPQKSFLAQGSRVPQFAPVFLAASLALLLQMSTAIVPWWSSGAGYTVEYLLYVDGKRERSYSYEITKKGVGWIVLLPVAWINFFTQDAKDAFRATAYQFFRDADRDGYFGGT
jgi:hypothetical protein